MIRVAFFVSLLASCEVLFINSLKDDSSKASFELFAGEQHGSTTSLFHKSFHQCSLDDGCNFVARNTKTNAFKKYSLEATLPKERKKFVIFKKKTGQTGKILKIDVLSGGAHDPGGKKSIITVNGIDYARHARGFNVVVLSGSSGDVISTGHFDTCFYQREADRMIVYINSIQHGDIVLISVEDDAALKMTTEAEQAIHALGATTRLTFGNGHDPRYRGSFALVTRKGGHKPFWFVEKSADGGKGPSQIEVSIGLN